MANKSPIKKLEELLQCFICMQRIEDAHMLPCCSITACKMCIESWLQHQQRCCPHCRTPINRSSLVPCRFVSQVAEVCDDISEDTMQAAQEDSSNPNKRFMTIDEVCEEHGAPLYYFCQNCSVSICSDCALFGEQHRGHTYDHMRDVFERTSEQLRKQKDFLNTRKESLAQSARTLYRDVEMCVERLQIARKSTVDAIRDTAERCLSRLDVELETRKQPLADHLMEVGTEVQNINSMIAEIESNLRSSKQVQLVESSKLLLPAVEELHKTPIARFSPPLVNDVFTNELAPEFTVGSLVIEDFSQARVEGDPIFSEPISTAPGVAWRLKVYPNGNGAARGAFLSVFVERLKTDVDIFLADMDRKSGHIETIPSEGGKFKGEGCDSSSFGGPSEGTERVNSAPAPSTEPTPHHYTYRVVLVNQEGLRENLSREYSSDFVPGESWGYNRLFPLDGLIGEHFLDAGILAVQFGVRAPTYYDQTRDVTNFVKFLEHEREQNQSAAKTTWSQENETETTPDKRLPKAPSHRLAALPHHRSKLRMQKKRPVVLHARDEPHDSDSDGWETDDSPSDEPSQEHLSGDESRDIPQDTPDSTPPLETGSLEASV